MFENYKWFLQCLACDHKITGENAICRNCKKEKLHANRSGNIVTLECKKCLHYELFARCPSCGARIYNDPLVKNKLGFYVKLPIRGVRGR